MQSGLDGYNGWLDGRREALEQTVEAYNKKLICYIGSLTHDHIGAEDISSEAFLRLLIKKPKFSCEEQLSSWLFRTARNLATDRMRKKRFEEDVEPPEEADGEEPVDALIRDERKKQLYVALTSLNDDYREVLILLYIEEFSYAQVGRIMKKSEAQIRNLAFRARQSAKEKLERMGFTYEDR